MRRSIALAVCFMVGCAADAGAESEAEVVLLEGQPSNWCALNGRWRTMCNPGQVGAVAREVIFDCGVLSYQQYEYSDTQCNTLRSAVTFEGAFQIGEALPNDPNARALDIKIFATSAAPLDGHAAEQMNAAAVCGRADWKAGVSRDIGGCDGVAGMNVGPGEQIHAAVARIGNELELADGSTGPVLAFASHPDARPDDARCDAYGKFYLKERIGD